MFRVSSECLCTTLHSKSPNSVAFPLFVLALRKGAGLAWLPFRTQLTSPASLLLTPCRTWCSGLQTEHYPTSEFASHDHYCWLLTGKPSLPAVPFQDRCNCGASAESRHPRRGPLVLHAPLAQRPHSCCPKAASGASASGSMGPTVAQQLPCNSNKYSMLLSVQQQLFCCTGGTTRTAPSFSTAGASLLRWPAALSFSTAGAAMLHWPAAPSLSTAAL